MGGHPWAPIVACLSRAGAAPLPGHQLAPLAQIQWRMSGAGIVLFTHIPPRD